MKVRTILPVIISTYFMFFFFLVEGGTSIAMHTIPVKIQREIVYKKSCYLREKKLLRKEMVNVLKYYIDLLNWRYFKTVVYNTMVNCLYVIECPFACSSVADTEFQVIVSCQTLVLDHCGYTCMYMLYHSFID